MSPKRGSDGLRRLTPTLTRISNRRLRWAEEAEEARTERERIKREAEAQQAAMAAARFHAHER